MQLYQLINNQILLLRKIYTTIYIKKIEEKKTKMPIAKVTYVGFQF